MIYHFKMKLFTDALLWEHVKDGNLTAFRIFQRHYSYKHKSKNINNLFGGPGEKLVLLSIDRKALFVWRKELFRRDGQAGINCSVFRNESKTLSSILIGQAEAIAQQKWPGERLFTFVDSSKIKGSNPGYCFKVGGWKQCGITKVKKLLIFEKYANQETPL